MVVPKDGDVHEEDVPLRNAMNEVLRDAYIDDNQRGVDRWNKKLEKAGSRRGPPTEKLFIEKATISVE